MQDTGIKKKKKKKKKSTVRHVRSVCFHKVALPMQDNANNNCD